MKTTFRLIGAVAAAAALFSSCKKEAFNEEVKPGTVEMTIIAGADDATRTVLGSDGAVTWSATGETLKVLENNGASNLSSYTSEEGISNDERKTMSFAVSLDSKTAETFDYFALYPSKSFVDGTYSDAKNVKVILPAQQSPSATSFDPTSDILVSKPVLGLAKQPTSLELQFARVVAIGKMNITNLDTEEKVKKVSFTATGKVVNGRSYINLEDASAVQYGYYAPSATVTLDYTEQSIAANEEMTAYFTCWPFELAAGDTFSVVVETENYIFTKDVTLAEGQSVAFKVGRASAFSVSFSGIKGVEKTPATQLVPDGAYVVAYQTNMMTVGTSSNKYMDVATLPTANEDNTYTVDATAAWNFVYDSDTDTYKIYSAADNTSYLQGSSSGSDFKLVAAADATSFTITKNEDGKFKIGITSDSETRYIGYNTQSPRFAMYKGSNQQPVDLNLYPAKVAILPKITVQKTLSVPSAETTASFPVTLTNVESVKVTVYKDAECNTEETEWITADLSDDKTAIEYVVMKNTGEARTAYIKIYALSSDENEATAIVTVTQAAASTGGETSWTRVTTVAELLAGGTFIIGYEATANSGEIVPMANTGSATTSAAGFIYSGSTAASGGKDTIDMSTVSETSNYEVTIVASTSVSGAICIKLGDNYLGNTNTKNKCKLFTAEAATTAFTPTVGDNDVFTLKIAANQTYHTLQYNTGSPRFAVYGGAQKNVVIYKKGN